MHLNNYDNGRWNGNPAVKIIMGIAVVMIGLFIILPVAGSVISFIAGLVILIILGALIFAPVMMVGSIILSPLLRILSGLCFLAVLIFLITGAGLFMPLIAVGLIIAGIASIFSHRNYSYRRYKSRKNY